MSEPKQATVTWTGEASNFVASFPSGFAVEMSAGSHSASPMDYLLAGVAGCTAVDVVSILHKMRQPLAGLRVEISGVRADDHPKVYTHVTLTYVAQGDVEAEALARAVELSKGKYCSASIMFQRAGVEFDVRTRIEAAEAAEAIDGN